MEQGAAATNVKAVWEINVFLKCKAKRGENIQYSNSDWMMEITKCS